VKTIVRNKNLRGHVQVIKETPNLDELGRAGIRLKLDQMLLAVHGQTTAKWQKLSEVEREVLRQMAREEDPAFGLSHQSDAIGAIGKTGDKGSLLLLSEIASDARAEMRLQIAATHAMGEIGGTQVISALRSLLKAKAPEVRAQAARALAKNGTGGDLRVLESFVQKDKTFAAEVARDAVVLLRSRLQQNVRSKAGG